jgi:thioredoxin 1
MSVEVLKFSATWCGPCRALAQTLKNAKEVKNIDIDSDRELAMKYGIRSVPTLVFLKDGVEVHRKSGSMSLDVYQQILNEINDSKEL